MHFVTFVHIYNMYQDTKSAQLIAVCKRTFKLPIKDHFKITCPCSKVSMWKEYIICTYCTVVCYSSILLVCNQTGDTEFQLLTWSKYHTLKLWNLDPKCWQVIKFLNTATLF